MIWIHGVFQHLYCESVQRSGILRCTKHPILGNALVDRPCPFEPGEHSSLDVRVFENYPQWDRIHMGDDVSKFEMGG